MLQFDSILTDYFANHFGQTDGLPHFLAEASAKVSTGKLTAGSARRRKPSAYPETPRQK
jgi:hypothetical protein